MFSIGVWQVKFGQQKNESVCLSLFFLLVLLHNILTKQEMLMDQMRIIMKTLQCMQSSQETEIGLDRNLLPLKDLTSLQSMEGNLRSTPDLHKQLVCEHFFL